MDDFDSNSVDVSSDEDSEDEWVEAMTCLSHLHLTASGDQHMVVGRKRRVYCYNRIDMRAFMLQYIEDPLFQVTIRMTRITFKYLVSLLEPAIQVDAIMAAKRGGQISTEMCTYMTLRYLAGGSHHDIKLHLGISKSSFYRCLTKTCLALCSNPELALHFPTTTRELEYASSGFESIVSNGSIVNCVGAVDGYLLSINTPSRAEVGNVRSYFSGHYQKYGINVQAVADSNCMFQYFALSGPGSSNDRVAILHEIDGVSLHNRIECLPGQYVIAADAAYKPTEHVVPIFYGTQRHNRKNDNFNFALAQCRIRVEMAFGIMQAKWRILRRPLENKLKMIKIIAISIARLHNFVLREQHGNDLQSLLRSISPDKIDHSVPNEYGDPQFPIPTTADINLYTGTKYQTCTIRKAMVERVAMCNVVRPSYSPLHATQIKNNRRHSV